MPIKDCLGNRIKTYYEGVAQTRLLRRTPVAIRVDGKNFHGFCRGLHRPFDEVFVRTMRQTTKYLCENITGCVLGYSQSDEITLILLDYQTLDTQAWFNYEVQKMCSITASMAGVAFNRFFGLEVDDYLRQDNYDEAYWQTLGKKMDTWAVFDARVFNIPREEVTNLIYWRQLDAIRNSINMVGRAYFSQKELHGKNTSDVQEMLWQRHQVDWDDYPTYLKRGTACIKKNCQVIDPRSGTPITKLRWELDLDIPKFAGEGREYIEKLIKENDERQGVL